MSSGVATSYRVRNSYSDYSSLSEDKAALLSPRCATSIVFLCAAEHMFHPFYNNREPLSAHGIHKSCQEEQLFGQYNHVDLSGYYTCSDSARSQRHRLSGSRKKPSGTDLYSRLGICYFLGTCKTAEHIGHSCLCTLEKRCREAHPHASPRHLNSQSLLVQVVLLWSEYQNDQMV